MRKILRIARREYRTAVRTKGFLIGLILAPILMSGGFIAMKISEKHIDTTDKHIAVIDHSGVMAPFLISAADARNAAEVHDQETGKKLKPAYLLKIVEPNATDLEAQRLALSDQVRNGQLNGFVEIGATVVHPQANPATARVTYHSHGALLDEVRGWLNWPINDQLRQRRLADAGLDETAVGDLFHWVNVEGLGLVSVDTNTGEIQDAKHSSEGATIGVPMILMMLMFLMLMMGAVPLLNAVMEEKLQRIAEVLLGSVKPFQFMMGKLIGGVAVSLTAASVYVVGGMVAFRQMGLGDYIPYHLVPWFFAYMITAITMMGAIFAALGSACNDAKDAQSMTFPAMLPMMLPMFIMVPILKAPQGSLATWLSFFPPCTPMLMLLRQSTAGGIPGWQPWVGLILILAFALLAIWAGGRIFRVGLLMQGNSPRLTDLARWVFRG